VAKQPLISIIVTSYTIERLNDIYELLDSIRTQSYQNLETIFVAERSAELVDRVKVYASKKNIYDLKVIFNQGEPGLSSARNLGIKQARGDIIAFVDDDALLFPEWAEAVVRVYEDDDIIGVTGPAFPLWEDESMAWFPEEFYWIISCTGWSNWDRMREVRNAWGMNMSFKREAFELGGFFLNDFGFHKGLVAEDNEFSLRVKAKTGKRIMYDPNMKLWHKVHSYRLSWRFIRERAYWIGRSRRNLKRLYAQPSQSENFLATENQLLRRILSHLLPHILKSLFKSPSLAWRKLSVTVIALSFVALGYYSYLFSNLLASEKVLIHQPQE
jgi:glycosyltransferase involved in cell wall biosynthesis